MPPSASPHGNTSWKNIAVFHVTVPELTNPISWLHLSYSALPFRTWWSEKSDWGQLYPGSRHAPNPWVCDHATQLYLHRFQEHPTHFMFCSIWLEISNLNCNSWCCLGAVAEPFLRGAVFFPCTSMAGLGPGWWGNICGASCFTAGSAYSPR